MCTASSSRGTTPMTSQSPERQSPERKTPARDRFFPLRPCRPEADGRMRARGKPHSTKQAARCYKTGRLFCCDTTSRAARPQTGPRCGTALRGLRRGPEAVLGKKRRPPPFLPWDAAGGLLSPPARFFPPRDGFFLSALYRSRTVRQHRVGCSSFLNGFLCPVKSFTGSPSRR